MRIYDYEAIPDAAGEKPPQFEVKQSMKDVALTHDPESGQRVRRLVQSGYLNTQRWTKSSGAGSHLPTSVRRPLLRRERLWTTSKCAQTTENNIKTNSP
jgi:hypothetical protein